MSVGVTQFRILLGTKWEKLPWIRYINKVDADHLIITLQKKYPTKINWKGDYYLGITLEWDPNKVHSEGNVKLSMSGYVKEALIKFNHESTTQQFSVSP